MINLGQAIKEFRERRRLTQVQLAGKVGMSVGFLSAVETGRRSPSLTFFGRIAKALRVAPEILLWEAIDVEHGMAAPDRQIIRRAKELITRYLKTT